MNEHDHLLHANRPDIADHRDSIRSLEVDYSGPGLDRREPQTRPLLRLAPSTDAVAKPTDNRGIRAVMEHGIKVAISSLWYSGAMLSRGLARLAGRKPTARFVVLYYHGVPLRPRFARQMQSLSRSATVVRAAHSGPLTGGGSHVVAITFDDALHSVRTNAVPELLAREFPATIFVPVDYVGRKPGWETKNGVDDRVMSRDELRSLPELIDIGSHSLTHPHLTKIDAASLREELTASRAKLAELIGNRVSLLAFPYGDYDDRVVDTCRQAGYERVFAIDPRTADPAGQDFVRGRVVIELHDGPLMFYLKSRGGYGWMIHASAIKRTMARWRKHR